MAEVIAEEQQMLTRTQAVRSPRVLSVPPAVLDRTYAAAKRDGALSLAVHPPSHPRGFSFSFIYLYERPKSLEGHACGVCLFGDGLYKEVLQTTVLISWPPPHDPSLALANGKPVEWPEPHQRDAVQQCLEAFYGTLSPDIDGHMVDMFGGARSIVDGSQPVRNIRELGRDAPWFLGLIAGTACKLRLVEGPLSQPEIVFRDCLQNALERIRLPPAERQ